MLYQVPLSFDPVGDHSHFPWIRPSSLLRTMRSTGDLRLLLGGIPTMSEAKGALESFWSIFQSVCPEHGVFRKLRESKGRLSTSQLIPILVHGDEGTTYKRGGMLVLQFTGVIGQGSKKSETPEEWHKHMASCGIPLNLIQNAMTTRFLTFLCPKDNDIYSDDPNIFKQIIELVVNDWKDLEEGGFEVPGFGTMFPIIVGNKGDWSYLVTSANLERSYRRAPRGRQEAKKAMKDPPGICYLCMGGTREGDWEDLNVARRLIRDARLIGSTT
ncbi:Putative hemoglobin and hemoglobin-haptoglobin-binding protein 3, partial [Durusdinium trenchii]